tara:strand:+ start:195 stop:728 length:534 start_codon:yes stop_codon:yes gene_type:complete
MAITVTKSTGGGYDEGWKTVTISNATKGDYSGSKYIDLFFEGYPETLKCRVWEARSGEGEEFQIANMVRYSNPTVLDELDKDGTTAASLDDSPAGLKGKSLQVFFYKKDNGYSEISPKVVPASPFTNIVDDITEERISRLKASAEAYIKRRQEANGVTTETTTTETTEGTTEDGMPW